MRSPWLCCDSYSEQLAMAGSTRVSYTHAMEAPQEPARDFAMPATRRVCRRRKAPGPERGRAGDGAGIPLGVHARRPLRPARPLRETGLTPLPDATQLGLGRANPCNFGHRTALPPGQRLL